MTITKLHPTTFQSHLGEDNKTKGGCAWPFVVYHVVFCMTVLCPIHCGKLLFVLCNLSMGMTLGVLDYICA